MKMVAKQPRSAKGQARTVKQAGVPGNGSRSRGLPPEAGRTRGGWVPAGTAAERRAVHAERSTPRGEDTRRQLVEAAMRVFANQGYLNASVDAIVAEAGVARGSFYTYFTSKLDVFKEVTDVVGGRIDQSVLARQPSDRTLDPVAALGAANARYLAVYRENGALYALIEQMAMSGLDDSLRAHRVERRRRDIDRVGSLIRRWQRRGLADPSVNPDMTASALLSMTSNFAFWTFVAHDREFDPHEAADVLTDIWVRAVGLRSKPRRAWLEGNQTTT